MKKRNIILFAIICTICLLLACGVVYAVDSSQQAEAYAHEIFPQLMQDCANDIEDYPYFKNADEAKTALLGKPIIVYTINSFDPDLSLSEQAKQISWYAFPVEVDGQPVTDLRVTLVNGDWVWDFGGSLNPMLNQVAAVNEISPKDCIAVMIGQPGPTYIITKKDGQEVAIRNYKNPASFELTQEGIQDIKTNLDTKRVLDENINDTEDIVTGTSDPNTSSKQNAGVGIRLINYLDYITHR